MSHDDITDLRLNATKYRGVLARGVLARQQCGQANVLPYFLQPCASGRDLTFIAGAVEENLPTGKKTE